MVGDLEPERATFRYAEGKWSLAEVVGHVIDAERVFAHRLFCISRGEKQPQPGFDEKDYIAASTYDSRTLASLLDEFELVRGANLAVVENLSAEQWSRRGVASDAEVTVRALAYMAAGHFDHHASIIKERYLGKV